MTNRESAEHAEHNVDRYLYAEVGVDDDRSAKLVEWLQSQSFDHTSQSTTSPLKGQLLARLPSYGALEQGIGGFASMHQLDIKGMKQPCLVTATDGVGTKVLLALEHNQLEGIGQDLVAMCVNDLFTLGARPLGFLDYYATSALDENQFKVILTGISKALKLCGCVLSGGETAQMPGLYDHNHFDLAGFMYGVVDKAQVLGPHRLRDEDVLYALPSSGFHANGFSLIRQWISHNPSLSYDRIDRLLAPTELYPEVCYLVETWPSSSQMIHACAHITGGGLSGNILRVMPKGARVMIDWSAWPIPLWMREFIEEASQRSWIEFEGVFNLGCGMILAVDQRAQSDFESACQAIGLAPVAVGAVKCTDEDVPAQLGFMGLHHS